MYKNVLVAIALDDEHQGEVAVALAKALQDPDGGITFLHVIENVPSYVAVQITAGLIDETRDKAIAELQKIAETAGITAQISVEYGHSGRTIVDYARDHDINCIVIASHRPGLQDYLIGSTASRVVRHASCSVHVIR
jgi:nucleotide-binding universal stress UspA family protein